MYFTKWISTNESELNSQINSKYRFNECIKIYNLEYQH